MFLSLFILIVCLLSSPLPFTHSLLIVSLLRYYNLYILHFFLLKCCHLFLFFFCVSFSDHHYDWLYSHFFPFYFLLSHTLCSKAVFSLFSLHFSFSTPLSFSCYLPYKSTYFFSSSIFHSLFTIFSSFEFPLELRYISRHLSVCFNFLVFGASFSVLHFRSPFFGLLISSLLSPFFFSFHALFHVSLFQWSLSCILSLFFYRNPFFIDTLFHLHMTRPLCISQFLYVIHFSLSLFLAAITVFKTNKNTIGKKTSNTDLIKKNWKTTTGYLYEADIVL